MFQNTKSLATASLLIILLGFGFLWFGLKPAGEAIPPPVSTPVVENSPVATSSAVSGIAGEKALVIEVVDGDTIKIEDGITVRLLGIDTPETKDPRRPVECFGKEAAREIKELVAGKFVVLEKDISETDKYGRLLRYVFLPLKGDNLLFVNDYLLREGFAKALTYPPDVKYTEQFLEAQKEAKELKKGLWGRC